MALHRPTNAQKPTAIVQLPSIRRRTRTFLRKSLSPIATATRTLAMPLTLSSPIQDQALDAQLTVVLYMIKTALHLSKTVTQFGLKAATWWSVKTKREDSNQVSASSAKVNKRFNRPSRSLRLTSAWIPWPNLESPTPRPMPSTGSI